MPAMKRRAFYGKRSVGKSTTSQNTIASLVDLGQKILIVDCYSKAKRQWWIHNV